MSTRIKNNNRAS